MIHLVMCPEYYKCAPLSLNPLQRSEKGPKWEAIQYLASWPVVVTVLTVGCGRGAVASSDSFQPFMGDPDSSFLNKTIPSIQGYKVVSIDHHGSVLTVQVVDKWLWVKRRT